jgi:intracellular sulfur oxidation DsrE/DsrF family protein
LLRKNALGVFTNLRFIEDQARMAKKAGKEIKLIAEAKIVPSGVVRLMELQEQGCSYIRP